MDRSILRLMPLLVQAAAVMGQRSFNVSTKTFLAQVDFARAIMPFPGAGDSPEATIPTPTAGAGGPSADS